MFIRILSIILVSMALIVFVSEQKVAGEKSSKKLKPVEKPPTVKRGNVPQPDITITESEDKVIKEYHINGELRAIKVIPKNGFPPYYLIDHEGTGKFVKLGPDMGPELQIPQWILFEW